jgi:hypothetical protein
MRLVEEQEYKEKSIPAKRRGFFMRIPFRAAISTDKRTF